MKKLLAILLVTVMMLSLCVCTAETDAKNRYIFELIDGHQQYIEGETFDGDVIISGDNAQIIFAGCVFNGDIINTAEVATRVLVLGCEVNGKCVIRNTTKEATLETSLPKFLVDAPVEAVCEDCVGSVIAFGDFEIIFNGESHAMANAEFFMADPEAGLVAYEGQEASYFCVAQWWENGEKVLMTLNEYDAEG